MNTTREALARKVDTARFTPVRLREGYDMDGVDRFLDALSAALRAGEDVREMVESSRFSAVRWREAYDMGEVDQFLDDIVYESSQTAPATTAAPPAPGPAVPEPTGPTGLNADVIAKVRTTRLGSKVFAEGYDRTATDALLDELNQRLDAGRTFDDLLLGRLPRRRGGYTPEQVDALLEQVRYAARYS